MLWTGRFCSSRYTFLVFPWVRGTIDVDLPADFDQEGVVVYTRATIGYDSVYRLGEKSNYVFTKDTGSGFVATSTSSSVQHDINFHVTKMEHNHISGTYHNSLDDEGSFWLTPKGENA